MKKKTALQQLIDWMEQNQYFIGNDLYVKQKELLETEREQIEEAHYHSEIEIARIFLSGLTKDELQEARLIAKQYYKDTYE